MITGALKVLGPLSIGRDLFLPMASVAPGFVTGDPSSLLSGVTPLSRAIPGLTAFSRRIAAVTPLFRVIPNVSEESAFGNTAEGGGRLGRDSSSLTLVY